MRAASWLVLGATGLAACHASDDGLAPARDLIVVAHQDDDLLFMQPDLLEAVTSGAGVTTVYVTAGNGATPDVDYATSRQTAVMAAYAAAAVESDWQCSWIDIAGHAARHCRLDGARVSLVFLGYPDGGNGGSYPNSLLDLWTGAIGSAATVAEQPASYDRDGLVATIAEIIARTRPRTIRTLDVAATHGSDHSDHELAAALALLAAGRSGSDAELMSFRGYDTGVEPVNKPGTLFAATFDMFAHYEACQLGCESCGEGACVPGIVSPGYVAWEQRRYAVGFRARLAGRLRIVDSDDRCANADATLGDCAGAPTWQLANHAIRGDRGCLAVDSDGRVVVRPCDGGLDQRLFADDEGQLWSAVPPPMVPAAGVDHLLCLSAETGMLHADLCGPDLVPHWTFEPPLVATAKTAIGLGASGRSVRIADIDGDGRGDLCMVEHDRLMCARGDGTGGFAAAVQIASDFAIEPGSLALGDIDGDGRADAYGLALDGSGLIAALAANGYVPLPWSSVFAADATAHAVTGTASSLAVSASPARIAGVCGLSALGLTCAGAQLDVLSTLPTPGEKVWTANLDDDGGGDWCGLGSNGVDCRPWGELGVAQDEVVPWSYALGGVVDNLPGDYDSSGLADIDGDGRDDLCALAPQQVACTRSQGRGFGPRTTLLVMPEGFAARSLWLGDLNGDGVADACVANTATVLCAVSP